jgi:hypothetical protein
MEKPHGKEQNPQPIALNELPVTIRAISLAYEQSCVGRGFFSSN